MAAKCLDHIAVKYNDGEMFGRVTAAMCSRTVQKWLVLGVIAAETRRMISEPIEIQQRLAA
jgi:hypothetical protein